MAAPVPEVNPLAMSDFLELNLGVTNNQMRANIQESGFDTLADLTRERPPFAKEVTRVRPMSKYDM